MGSLLFLAFHEFDSLLTKAFRDARVYQPLHVSAPPNSPEQFYP